MHNDCHTAFIYEGLNSKPVLIFYKKT